MRPFPRRIIPLADGFGSVVKSMTGSEALGFVLERLPESRPFLDLDIIEGNKGEDALLHVAMGDLARFYMARCMGDRSLRRRFWATVEDLAANGGHYVEDAIGTSLIEWFAWGSASERRALRRAMRLHGPATSRIVDHYRADLRRGWRKG